MATQCFLGGESAVFGVGFSFMDKAAFRYIKEVLGISSVLVPVEMAHEGALEPSLSTKGAALSEEVSSSVKGFTKGTSQEASINMKVSGDLSGEVLFLTAEELVEGREVLLTKMIQAMRLSNYAVASQANCENLSATLEGFSGSAIVAFGSEFSALQEKHKEYPWTQTHALSSLMHIDEAQKKRKQETWLQLKAVMQALLY